MTAPLLDARGIGMRFDAVRALDGVDLALARGEVLGIVGENGAGKSTLVRILGGELTAYSGTLAVDGRPVRFDSPRDALAAGIAVILQELQLVPSLTVAENITLGREPRSRGGLVDRAAAAERARHALAPLGLHSIGADDKVSTLDPADRQLVAIARALSLDARCLIMDEPTASLGSADSFRLEMVVKSVAAAGTGVIYISHKLDEVRRLAGRVLVLRDGVRVATPNARDVSEPDLVRLMVGRSIEPAPLADPPPSSAELLRVEQLSVRDRARHSGYRLRDIDFAVRAGEIVGLAGLVGAGRSDLLLAIVGALGRPVEGRIAIAGAPYVPSDPAQAERAGLVLLPEERKSQAIFPRLSTAANITISALRKLSPWGWRRQRSENDTALELMRRTGVRAAGPDAPIATLSGGNQQKALLARALFAGPKVLLLDEPTRGVDIAAKEEVYAQIRALAASGFAVVVCSSETAELIAQCHRLLVFRAGEIVARFERAEATEEKVVAAATGVAASSADAGSGAPPSPNADRAARLRRILARSAPLIGLAAVLVLGAIFSPVRRGSLVFLGLGNLTDILRQVSEKGILAVGMTAVVISGGIDLSVGSLLAFGATLTAWLLMLHGAGVMETLFVVLTAGAAWGVLNGVVVAKLRLPAFIATLATMSAARGAARLLSGGSAIPLGFGAGGAPESFRALAAPIVPFVPAPALIFVGTVLAMHVYLARTRAGRYLYAIGDNETAARLAGVRVDLHKGAVYVLAALLAALAGLVHAAQLEQGNPNDGVAYELDAIAAVVIGGTPLSGGTGTVGGTLIGILIIGIINNIMGLNNVDANLQLILKGVIILGAVWLQRRS